MDIEASKSYELTLLLIKTNFSNVLCKLSACFIKRSKIRKGNYLVSLLSERGQHPMFTLAVDSEEHKQGKLPVRGVGWRGDFAGNSHLEASVY